MEDPAPEVLGLDQVRNGVERLDERAEDEVVEGDILGLGQRPSPGDEVVLEGLDEEQRPERVRAPLLGAEQVDDGVAARLVDVLARGLASEDALDVADGGEFEVGVEVVALGGVANALFENDVVENACAANVKKGGNGMHGKALSRGVGAPRVWRTRTGAPTSAAVQMASERSRARGTTASGVRLEG